MGRSRSRSRERRRSRSPEDRRRGDRRDDDCSRRDERGRRDDRDRGGPREDRRREEDRGERRGREERDREREPREPRDHPSGPPPPAPPSAPSDPALPRKEPLSMEELLRKKAEEEEEAARPKFLTKEERAKLALQRRQEEVAAQRAGLGAGASFGSGRPAEDVRRRMDDARKEQEKLSKEREAELEMIKRQYLGAEKVKKRVAPASERMKFVFDWKASEDTSRDLNPLYDKPAEVSILFGRGLLAGTDRREQKKSNERHERLLLERQKEAFGDEAVRIQEELEALRKSRARDTGTGRFDATKRDLDLHWSEKRLEDMTERDWRIFREDFNIAYKGAHTEFPLRSWDECDMPGDLRRAIDKLGYKDPSPIQRAAIPLGLKQKDVIGIAETGSGKTAAFSIPMITYISRLPAMDDKRALDGPYAIVMAPTRELAQQIEEEVLKLCQFIRFRAVSIVGGLSIEEQAFKLRQGAEIVIATPGRMLDCIDRHYVVLNQCNYIVLDEADRMIDLGFEPQVNSVMEAMPASHLKPEDHDEKGLDPSRMYRVTYMFSATMPPAVEKLARKYLRKPVVVNIGTAGRTTENITQRIIMCKDNEKNRILTQELAQANERRAIVFVNTKTASERVTRHLEALNYRVAVLHGGRSQEQREASLQGFRDDKYNVLVATDVAGRGIDVPDVALVVNFEMPDKIEPYTHRIGRTGRAGRKGIAVTLLTPNDTGVYYDLVKLLTESRQQIPAELAKHEASKAPMGPGGKGGREGTKFAL